MLNETQGTMVRFIEIIKNCKLFDAIFFLSNKNAIFHFPSHKVNNVFRFDIYTIFLSCGLISGNSAFHLYRFKTLITKLFAFPFICVS